MTTYGELHDGARKVREDWRVVQHGDDQYQVVAGVGAVAVSDVLSGEAMSWWLAGAAAMVAHLGYLGSTKEWRGMPPAVAACLQLRHSPTMVETKNGLQLVLCTRCGYWYVDEGK